MASKLANEITNDPLNRYSGMTDKQILTSLYTVNISRNRTSMSGREVKSKVVNSEYDSLTDAAKSQFLSLTSSNDLNPFGLAANVVKNIFGNGSATVAALATSRIETISRVVELSLGRVKLGHISIVRS